MADPTQFKDHFSVQAGAYERHRPGYPRELFEFLAESAPGRGRALDVGAGNGQASLGLADFFDEVVATEPSRAQLDRARPHARITYLCEPAERMSARDASFDLVIAAQAAHWFDWKRFPAEVLRVLRPGGVVAIWTYGLFSVDDAVDRVVADFYRNVTGPYWPRERRHVEESYASLPFPFDEQPAPAFAITRRWVVDDVLGYLGTWSAVERYRRMRGTDPVGLVASLLQEGWGHGERLVSWPVHLRVGRKAPEQAAKERLGGP